MLSLAGHGPPADGHQTVSGGLDHDAVPPEYALSGVKTGIARGFNNGDVRAKSPEAFGHSSAIVVLQVGHIARRVVESHDRPSLTPT